MILAIDPSIRSAGAALFVNGTLLAAARVTLGASERSDEIAENERSMALKIRAWVCRAHGLNVLGVAQYRCLWDHLVSERPQIYARERGKSRADPNDQLGMVGVTGALGALQPDARIKTYTPAAWKGQTPKPAILARIRIALTPTELALLPESHDAGEAVGIGLRFLGRLEPRRVYPGAT